MSRDLSPDARTSIAAEEVEEVFVGLLTLDHEVLEAPIRVSTDAVDTVSDGVTYKAYPMQLVLPGQAPDRASAAQIRIANVDRRIVRAVREVSGEPPTIAVDVVLASAPDDIVEGFTLELRRTTYNAAWVTGELGSDDFLDRRWPKDNFDPSLYPGLF